MDQFGGRNSLKAVTPPDGIGKVRKSGLRRKKEDGVPGIIPGDWGKVGPGWLARPLSNKAERRSEGGNIHQFLWRRSRAVSTREKGTERRGTMRNRSELSQVARAGFGSG